MKTTKIESIIHAYKMGRNEEAARASEISFGDKLRIEQLEAERVNLVKRIDELTKNQFETMCEIFDKVAPGQYSNEEIRKHCL